MFLNKFLNVLMFCDFGVDMIFLKNVLFIVTAFITTASMVDLSKHFVFNQVNCIQFKIIQKL